MSSLLVKEPSPQLHDWLRDEARFNGRSINSQVIICLEWCMQTYGPACRRPPFGPDARVQVVPAKPTPPKSLRGAFSHLKPLNGAADERNAWRKAAEAKHANAR